MIHHAHFKSYGDGAYLTSIMGGGSRFHPRKANHNPADDLFHMDGLEYYSQMNLMKGGMLFADRLTTVSPRYAKEIQTPEFGCGLDGVVQTRADDIVGLLNGAR